MMDSTICKEFPSKLRILRNSDTESTIALSGSIDPVRVGGASIGSDLLLTWEKIIPHIPGLEDIDVSNFEATISCCAGDVANLAIKLTCYGQPDNEQMESLTLVGGSGYNGLVGSSRIIEAKVGIVHSAAQSGPDFYTVEFYLPLQSFNIVGNSI
jgi:hypothetical protein